MLIASIVDPVEDKGGAGTVTRGLQALIRHCYPTAQLVTVAPGPARWRKGRQAFCVASALVTPMPAKVRYLYRRSFAAKIQRMLRQESFDFLVVNGSDLAWCLDLAPAHIPKVTVVHNTESRIYYGQLASLHGPLRLLASVLNHDVRRLARYELEGLRRVSGAIFLSEADAEYAAGHLPALKFIVMPPVFPEPPRRTAKRPSRFLELGFLANLGWWPNREGLDWFLREVFPLLPSDVHLNLFGAGTRRLDARHPRITGHGFVSDLNEVWDTCDWMIVPIREGSGVAVKTAECLHHGMPILTTSFGLRGLPAVESPLVIRLESASEWIQFLASLQARQLCKDRLPLSCSGAYSVEFNASRFGEFCRALTSLCG